MNNTAPPLLTLLLCAAAIAFALVGLINFYMLLRVRRKVKTIAQCHHCPYFRDDAPPGEAITNTQDLVNLSQAFNADPTKKEKL